MTNTCVNCGKQWESEGHSAVVHKTTMCAECKGGAVPVIAAPREQLDAETRGLLRVAGRKTEHTFEGLPVFFNPTAPPHLFMVVEADDDPVPDPDRLELHGQEAAYHKVMADLELRQATRRMIRLIKAALRKKRMRRRAPLN